MPNKFQEDILKEISEIKQMLSTLLQSKDIRSKETPEALFNKYKAALFLRMQSEWDAPEHAPLHAGRFFLAVPEEKKEFDLSNLLKLTQKSIVEWTGHAVIWPLMANEVLREKDQVSFVWPKKNGFWIRDFGGTMSFANQSGHVGYYDSYWEDLRPQENNQKHLGVFSTLIKTVLFLKFIQNFMNQGTVQKMIVFSFLSSTKDRLLIKEDPRFVPFFLQNYACADENVSESIVVENNFDPFAATLQLCHKLLWHFNVPDDFDLKKLFMNWGKDALIKLGLPFQE